jgi:hypothetical protein
MSRMPGTKPGAGPTTYEPLMTDLPDSAADQAANASTPDGGTPGGDPELAALVRADARADAGDPELAALVSPCRQSSDARGSG